jgi:hypothetical protein
VALVFRIGNRFEEEGITVNATDVFGRAGAPGSLATLGYLSEQERFVEAIRKQPGHLGDLGKDPESAVPAAADDYGTRNRLSKLQDRVGPGKRPKILRHLVTIRHFLAGKHRFPLDRHLGNRGGIASLR